MSKTKEPVYSEEKAKQALANKEYIKIGGGKGTLKLTGASRKWKVDPTFTYVSSLRVAGKPSDIVEQLTALGWSAADVRAAVKAGFTGKSLQDADYLAELAVVKGPKKSPRKSSPVVLTHDIAYYADALEKAVSASKTVSSPKKKKTVKKAAKTKSKSKSPKKKAAKKSPKKATKTRSKSPKKASATKSKSPKKASPKVPKGKTALKDKLAKLKAGKVMDVSSFTLKEQDAKVIDKPGSKSKKYVVGKLASDKKNGIKAAAAALGDAALVAKWEAVRTKASGKGSPKRKSASPKRKSSPKKTSPRKSSPRKSSPAASLPMSPSNSPRSGGLNLPSLPVTRVPTIGSPSRSPRL